MGAENIRFFEWLDPETCRFGKRVLLGLYQRINCLEGTICTVDEKNVIVLQEKASMEGEMKRNDLAISELAVKTKMYDEQVVVIKKLKKKNCTLHCIVIVLVIVIVVWEFL